MKKEIDRTITQEKNAIGWKIVVGTYVLGIVLLFFLVFLAVTTFKEHFPDAFCDSPLHISDTDFCNYHWSAIPN